MTRLPSTVLLLTHYYAYGPADDLERFLANRIKRLVVIKAPLFPRPRDPVYIRVYEKSNAYSMKHRLPSAPLATQRLMSYMIMLVKSMGWDFDVAIGQDPITTLIADALKSSGHVSLVVFHSHSYTAPHRGRLYKLLDYLATRRSDVVWALSRRLVHIRRALGARRVLHVPVCIRDDVVPLRGEHASRVIFVGRLSRDKGVDLLIRALPKLLELYDEVLVIGKGPYERVFNRLTKVIKGLRFLGPRPLAESMSLAASSSLGLVLSRPSLEVLTTDPMKPKVYLAAGTPVVLPRYFELSSLVEEEGAGVAVQPRLLDIIVAVRRIALRADEAIAAASAFAYKHDYWKCSTILSRSFEETWGAGNEA